MIVFKIVRRIGSREHLRIFHGDHAACLLWGNEFYAPVLKNDYP